MFCNRYNNTIVPMAYSEFPILKEILTKLALQKIPIGYFVNHFQFIELKDLSVEGSVLFCIEKDITIPVSNIIARTQNHARARWLNHVYVQTNAGLSYTLLREY